MRSLNWLFALLFTLTSSAFALEPDILMVLDAGAQAKQEQLEEFYGPLCLAAQRTYQVWNVSQAGTVPTSTLSALPTIVWLTGENAQPAGIPEASAALRAHAANGGNVVLAGLHAASAAREFLASDLGIEFKRHNTLITELLGRFPDVIAQGWKLKLPAGGCETAAYAKADERHAETVFSVADRGVMRLAAARIESLGETPARAVWFGFDLPGVSDAARAREVFTRAIRWTAPAPELRHRRAAFRALWHSR